MCQQVSASTAWRAWRRLSLIFGQCRGPSRLKQTRLRLTEAEAEEKLQKLSPLHTNVHIISSFHVKRILLFLLPLCIEDSLDRSSVGIGELSVFLSRDASSLILLILELHLLSTVYRRRLRVSFELPDQYFLYHQAATIAMSSAQMALEYLLVCCTSHGLTSIGEPPLPKTYRPVGDSLIQTQRGPHHSTATKRAVPEWIIFIFLSLATAKYILSFAVSKHSPTYFPIH